MHPRTAATLLRLALAEIGEYPLVAAEKSWTEALAAEAAHLMPEDGWALVGAARLLAENPDPGFWAKVGEGRAGSLTG